MRKFKIETAGLIFELFSAAAYTAALFIITALLLR
jgi:hypothetical protein